MLIFRQCSRPYSRSQANGVDGARHRGSLKVSGMSSIHSHWYEYTAFIRLSVYVGFERYI